MTFNMTESSQDTRIINNNELDRLLVLIMNEISKIQQTEVADYSYSRIILLVLIMAFIYSIRTRLHKMLHSCFRSSQQKNDQQVNSGATGSLIGREDSLSTVAALDKITIQKLNYMVTR